MTVPVLPIDLYGWFDTLTADENHRRLAMRTVLERDIAPVADDHWDRGEFYHEALAGFHALDPLAHYFDGDSGNRTMIDGLYSLELARVDPSMASYYGVHGGLCLGSIMLLGSDAQRDEWLPHLRAFSRIGCFGLTEANHGSDPGGMESNFIERSDYYLLNGAKLWITNGPIADIAIVWAKNEQGKIRGLIIERGMDGFTTAMHGSSMARRSGSATRRSPTSS